VFFKGINHYGDLGLILDFGSDSSQQISQEVNAVYALLQDLDLPQLNIIPSFNKIVLASKTVKIATKPKMPLSIIWPKQI
jgi:50S ribosomal subunit-associated GTPase HflX